MALGFVEVGAVQLLAGPFNAAHGALVEIFGHQHQCFFVIAEDREIEPLHGDIENFARVGAVIDEVTEAENLFATQAVYVFHDGGERFDVRMDVRNKSDAHCRAFPNPRTMWVDSSPEQPQKCL